MHKVSVVVIFIILWAGLVNYIVVPAQEVSLEEKRSLAVFPQIQWDSYIQGHLTDSIADYIDDHFPVRELFVGMLDEINYYKGLHLNSDEKIVKSLTQTISPTMSEDTSEEATQDSTVYDNINGYFQNDMLVINGAVFPISGGTPRATRYFAKMANGYARKLSEQVRVIVAVSPLSSAFIPSDKYRYLNRHNRQTLDTLHHYLSSDVLYANVFEHLNAHSTEYIFFKTDHHWTALGAYYAYQAFCEATQIKPVPKANMEKRTKSHFLGSLYSLTHDRSVKNNPDMLEYYVPHVTTKALRYEPNSYEGVRSTVFCHKCKGYDTFLCADFPLMKITTDVKNGKKIIVIKDSMGNAFVVYLVSHYEEIWVVDFRYSQHNLLRLIRENNINDMVFAVGMYNAQSYGVAQMMSGLATQEISTSQQDTILKDTTLNTMPIDSNSVSPNPNATITNEMITNDTINKNTINKNTVRLDSADAGL
ncbi:hypothetical protein FACS1894199_15300 [Bacteroidia bacterium]|nr:hypothetical protein FACS1894199_15300 [Bacteroidia bacterium]